MNESNCNNTICEKQDYHTLLDQVTSIAGIFDITMFIDFRYSCISLYFNDDTLPQSITVIS